MWKVVTAISNGKLSSPESLAYQEKILVTEISAMTQRENHQHYALHNKPEHLNAKAEAQNQYSLARSHIL